MRRATLAFLLLALPCQAQIRSVTLHGPARTFGYMIGDVLVSEAVITADPGVALDATSLPAPGPVSTWVDLRHIDVTRKSVAGSQEITIRTEYQNFYAPEDATRVAIPPYAVAFTRNGARVEAPVPGWKFIASPLRHAILAEVESSALKADHPFLTVPLARTRAWFFAAIALAAVAAFWWAQLGGLLPSLALRSKPFAQARRRIARLGRSENTEACRPAMLELHRAFDATAGSRVMADDVAAFLDRHARFRPHRADIENFFGQSRRMFFGTHAATPAWSREELAAFGRRLSRAERGA